MDEVPKVQAELLLGVVREQVEEAVRKVMGSRECRSGGESDWGQRGGGAGHYRPVATAAFRGGHSTENRGGGSRFSPLR